MVGYWNYTVWLTYISTLLAVLGVSLCIINPGHSADYAVLCLLVCGGLDMFDGKVARTKKDRTEFEKDNGIQIDSLSDLLAFGILPAAIALRLFLDSSIKEHSIAFAIVVVALLFYVLFGLVRLGYFNALEHERSKTDDSVLKFYTGMPITMAAFFMPIAYLFKFTNMSSLAFAWLYFAVLVILGLLFVLKIKVPKAGKKMIIAFSVFGCLFLIAFVLLKFM
ncbi:MAG: CDP-alcohol phosphatidyltransferase family protein [Acholeplasmatales bacterium]|nr:CDP-alcohol phosphatidyltransferase family protein [Acholeplasmatales bacterium]